ncbi:MAG: hypothetical protein GF344_13060 [Chitinivibrionales bacterium]|nr:hypothetical protein [Chitinivibrionales bacterium]MBD3357664.1 hypothetical protein [Chitinivibrionales bacterium]
MIIPRTTDVQLSIYNRIGNMVFADTLVDVMPGAYLQKNRHYKWYAVDNNGNDVESGIYIYQIRCDLFQKTGQMRVSRLRRLPDGKHPLFSSFYNIDEVPGEGTKKNKELPYGEEGVYGATIKGRLAICYTEGYKEKEPLSKSDSQQDDRKAALKWITNVVIHSLAEGSLAR